MEKFGYITRELWKPLREPTRWFDTEFLDGVDTELLKLLEKIEDGTPLREVHSLVADLCDSRTHSDRPDKRVGVEKNVLLMPDWRTTWQHGGDVQWMYFPSVVGLKTLNELDYLYELFRQLVRLVAEGETDVLRDEIVQGELVRALRGYLSLRGYGVSTATQVATTSDGLEYLAARLTHGSYKLVAYLWDGKPATFEDLVDNVWEKPISDSGIEKSIRRTNEKLTELCELLTIVMKNSHATLEKLSELPDK
jgi:hypothetical protein